jgi:hypothetical protein
VAGSPGTTGDARTRADAKSREARGARGDGARPDATDEPRALQLRNVVAKPAAFFLILLMAVGSVFLWLGIPFLWIWGVSQMVDTSQPTFGPYIAIAIGLPASMFVFGRFFLWKLNDIYARVTGQTSELRVQLAWLRSMRGERQPQRTTSVLDVVMIVSVAIALVAFGIWFFFFAGSSLPNS